MREARFARARRLRYPPKYNATRVGVQLFEQTIETARAAGDFVEQQIYTRNRFTARGRR
jgi:hypothetical protein